MVMALKSEGNSHGLINSRIELLLAKTDAQRVREAEDDEDSVDGGLKGIVNSRMENAQLSQEEGNRITR